MRASRRRSGRFSTTSSPTTPCLARRSGSRRGADRLPAWSRGRVARPACELLHAHERALRRCWRPRDGDAVDAFAGASGRAPPARACSNCAGRTERHPGAVPRRRLRRVPAARARAGPARRARGGARRAAGGRAATSRRGARQPRAGPVRVPPSRPASTMPTACSSLLGPTVRASRRRRAGRGSWTAPSARPCDGDRRRSRVYLTRRRSLPTRRRRVRRRPDVIADVLLLGARASDETPEELAAYGREVLDET